MKKSLLVVLIVIGFLTVGFVKASAETIIDFEGLSDSDIVTNQFPGLTFENTIVLTAGISLNEFEFPPKSGINVVFDNGGPIAISFDTPMFGVGAYFTYLTKLTLSFLDIDDNEVGKIESHFDTNLALSGDPGSVPNEFLNFSSAPGISKVVITGDPSGGSFTMDDLTLTSVPEPATLILLGCGIIGIAFKKRLG